MAVIKVSMAVRKNVNVFRQKGIDKTSKECYNNNRKRVMIMRIDVSIICSFCGEDHAVGVNLAQYEAWQNGELIQNAMPDLTPTEREQLISGLCPKCQAEIFGE